MAQTLLAKRPTNPELAPRAVPLNQKILAELEKIDALPHLSDTIVKAMKLVNDPNSSLAEMATLICRDSLLAATVLKIANSPVYGGGRPISDLRFAVGRLGFRGCANLIASIGMQGLYKKFPMAVRVNCETILRHSLFAAILATGMNKVLRLDLQGEEFTGALLHDIGRLVICVKVPDHFEAANLSNYDQAENVCAAERSAFNTDHCAVGSLFAVKNNLPKSIGRVIAQHHTPARELEFRDLVGLVAFADALANHIQVHHNVNKFVPETALGFAEVCKKADRDKVQQLLEKLPKIVVEAVREARGMMKSIS